MSGTSLRTRWLGAHPYLEPLAALHEALAAVLPRVLTGWTCPPLASPSGADPDGSVGTPLLSRDAWPADAGGLGARLAPLAAALADAGLPESLAGPCRDLAADPCLAPERAAETLSHVLGADGDLATPHAGLLRVLGWGLVREAFGAQFAAAQAAREARGDEAWPHAHCPTCGARPGLALLAPHEAGKRRLLACAVCGTRWSYRRLGCPFCGTEQPDRLDALEIEGEEGVRLDACRACGGYWKTVTADADAAFLLADWSTLHLDVLARERGLERKGASLFEV